MSNDRKINFQRWIPFKSLETQFKYLRLPSYFRRSKQQYCNYVQDCIWKKLKSWKKNFLSSTGCEVLMKSEVQSILTYIMDCFLLLKYLCYIKVMIKQFWLSYMVCSPKIFTFFIQNTLNFVIPSLQCVKGSNKLHDYLYLEKYSRGFMDS